MSKKSKKVVAKAKVDTRKEAPKADVKTVAEKVAAEMARKQAEQAKQPAKVPQGKSASPDYIEVPKPCALIDFKHGIFGAFKADDQDCQDCKDAKPETEKACKHNTELMQQAVRSRKVKATASGEKKARAPKEGVELDCFGRRVNSGAGRIDALLLRKEGATMEEMEKERKAVGSHLSALKTEGYDVTFKDGKYFAKAPAKK